VIEQTLHAEWAGGVVEAGVVLGMNIQISQQTVVNHQPAGGY
jgi:hypothetical protein